MNSISNYVIAKYSIWSKQHASFHNMILQQFLIVIKSAFVEYYYPADLELSFLLSDLPFSFFLLTLFFAFGHDNLRLVWACIISDTLWIVLVLQDWGSFESLELILTFLLTKFAHSLSFAFGFYVSFRLWFLGFCFLILGLILS